MIPNTNQPVAVNTGQMTSAYEQLATDLFEENQQLRSQLGGGGDTMLMLNARNYQLPLQSQLFAVWNQNSVGMGREYAEEIFRDYSRNGTALTKAASFGAVEEILRHWNMALTMTQQGQLRDDLFEKSWNRITAGQAELPISDAYALLRDIMTPSEVYTPNVVPTMSQPVTTDRQAEIANRVIERRLLEQHVNNVATLGTTHTIPEPAVELFNTQEPAMPFGLDTDTALKVVQHVPHDLQESPEAERQATRGDEPDVIDHILNGMDPDQVPQDSD